MMRSGATLPEILNTLKAFHLPSSESAALEQQLQKAMDQIVETRSGVVKELSDAEIERVKAAAMVSFPALKNAVKNELVPTVQRVIAAGLGPTALRHLLKEKSYERPKTLATTALAQFNNQLTLAGAEASGTTAFVYFGPISAGTRPFCRAHAGKVFTLEEIQKMDNGQGISVRSSLGGYNCRHYWVATDEQPGAKQMFQIGSKTLLMDASRQDEFFSRQRVYYVEANKAQYASANDLNLARLLAITHDSLNERITGQPADGLWAQRLSKKIVDGKKIIQTNFEKHFFKRKKNNEVSTVDQFRTQLKNIIRNSNAVVYQTTADDGTLRYIVHDEKTGWIMLLNNYGAIETSYKHNTETPTWNRRKKIGTLRTFIGEF